MILSSTVLFVSNQIKLSYVTNIPNDELTGAIETIDYAHHEIHEGDHYFISHLDTITGTKNLLFRNNQSDKTIHILYEITTSDQAEIRIYENVTVTSMGTKWNQTNNNRNFPDTNSVLYVSDGTVTFTDGLIIGQDFTGSNKNSGFVNREQEIILRHNTDYIFQVVPTNPNTKISCLFEWYEKE